MIEIDWPEFCSRLENYDGEGCSRDESCPISRKILAEMGVPDAAITESLGMRTRSEVTLTDMGAS